MNDKCKKCIHEMSCKLDGDYRRSCFKNRQQYFKPKEMSG